MLANRLTLLTNSNSQTDKCSTKRNWTDTIVVTGLNCMSCDDFTTINDQVRFDPFYIHKVNITLS